MRKTLLWCLGTTAVVVVATLVFQYADYRPVRALLALPLFLGNLTGLIVSAHGSHPGLAFTVSVVVNSLVYMFLVALVRGAHAEIANSGQTLE